MGLGFRIKQYLKMYIQNVYLPKIYKKAVKKTDVNPNRIIMADMHSDSLPYSMQAVYAALIEKGYIPEIYCRDISKMSHSDSIKYMKGFMKDYAAAGYVFICSYFLPVSSCDKRPETKVVQLWHSGGLMKKMGYDTKDDIPKFYKGTVTKNYDLVTVSAPVCVPVWESALKLPAGVTKPLGLARTDIYYNEEWKQSCRDRFYALCPEAKGKKIVLYAPSFSGNASDPRCVGIESGIEEVFSGLGDEYYPVIRLHPHLKKKYSRFWKKDAAAELPTEKLLPVADIMITDYSSVLFDYSIFRKPFILFCPDYKEYEKSRGFYADINSFPAPIAKTADELKQVFETKSYEKYTDSQLEEFYAEYMGSSDGHSTDRILKEVGL